MMIAKAILVLQGWLLSTCLAASQYYIGTPTKASAPSGWVAKPHNWNYRYVVSVTEDGKLEDGFQVLDLGASYGKALSHRFFLLGRLKAQKFDAGSFKPFVQVGLTKTGSVVTGLTIPATQGGQDTGLAQEVLATVEAVNMQAASVQATKNLAEWVYSHEKKIGPFTGGDKPQDVGFVMASWKPRNMQSALLLKFVTDDNTKEVKKDAAEKPNELWQTLESEQSQRNVDPSNAPKTFSQTEQDVENKQNNIFKSHFLAGATEWRGIEGDSDSKFQFVKGRFSTSVLTLSIPDDVWAELTGNMINTPDLEITNFLVAVNGENPQPLQKVVLERSASCCEPSMLVSVDADTSEVLRAVAAKSEIAALPAGQDQPENREQEEQFWGLYTDSSNWAAKSQHTTLWVFFAVVIVLAVFLGIKERPDCGKDEAEMEAVTDIEADGAAKKTDGFRKFQLLYLAGWYFCFFADWLNGTVIFEIIVDDYGWSDPTGRRQYFNEFMVFGFATAVILGVFIGSVADTVGRRTACLFYCIMNGLMAVSFFFNNYWILALGQFTNGIATRLLFTTFEAWYVQEHFKRGYSGQRLGSSLGWMYFGGSVSAILAGLVSQGITMFAGTKIYTVGPAMPEENKMSHFSVNWGGRLYVYALMFACMVIGFLIISLTWTTAKDKPAHGGTADAVEDKDKEDSLAQAPRTSVFSMKSTHTDTRKSNDKDALGTLGSIKKSFGLLTQDRRILLLGLSVALFEGSMYLFVCSWTASFFTIDSYLNLPASRHNIQQPILFATLLSGYLIGSCLCNVFLSRGTSGKTLACWVMLLGSFGLSLPATVLYVAPIYFPQADTQLYLPDTPMDQSGTVLVLQIVMYTGFVLFEMAVGMYFPTMGGVKASMVPEDIRATLYNIFYIPSNLMICLVLMWHFFSGHSLQTHVQLFIAVGAIGLGFILMSIFRLMGDKNQPAEDTHTEDDEEAEEVYDTDNEAAQELLSSKVQKTSSSAAQKKRAAAAGGC
ncbi:unnamed protein product [Amoebophrya sp. A120]|nr:unnamed protein product [Amoebophrya sp. A120]|eukprot:GSA120T00002292001.1